MSFGVFSQEAWPGVGDVDECWIIATYWALVATGVVKREDLPSIAKFRSAAGRPDRKGPTGGSNTVIMKALEKLLPKGDYRQVSAITLTTFKKELKRGYVASLSVRSSQLPEYLRFGFNGTHQVSIYLKANKFYVANPLAKEGSPLLEISERDLQRAAGGLYGDGRFHAVLIKSKPNVLKTVQPPPAPRQPRTLKHTVPTRDYLEPYAATKFYESRPGGARDASEGDETIR